MLFLRVPTKNSGTLYILKAAIMLTGVSPLSSGAGLLDPCRL